MTFTLTPEQELKASEFQAEREAASPTRSTAIGGRWSYVFSPTSIGVVVEIVDCHDNVKCDLTDYDSW